jgi:serine/threonine-protein kinase
MVVQTIDGVSFQMKEAFDYSFLSAFGKVFRVFDQSSSGCICFGMEKDGKRYFLKFAGAHTINDALRNIEDTILRLKYSVLKYKEMKHPLLVNLVDAMEIGGGYLTVFDWFDGESCGYPQREMCERFITLPIEKKMRVYDGILEFHAHVIKCGYVAIDFNDQATMYNFDNGEFLICDIDFYAKQYYMNGYSGIWGDPSLMSPEEKRNGAVVDEISNVYAMGATAFVFFAEDDKNSRKKWTLSSELYEVAKKAVSEQRNGRQQSISNLITEWNAAKVSLS